MMPLARPLASATEAHNGRTVAVFGPGTPTTVSITGVQL